MLYWIFLAVNAAEMIWEARIAARNSAALLRDGAVEIAPKILPLMMLMYVVMYAGCFAESAFFQRQIATGWGFAFAGLFVLAKALKLWAVSALGRFWTMKVLILPGSTVVKTGPYRYIRHPNYVAVLLEIASTILLGKCFFTFLFVFVSFSIVLVFRIRAEEQGLLRYTDYSNEMSNRRRFVP